MRGLLLIVSVAVLLATASGLMVTKILSKYSFFAHSLAKELDGFSEDNYVFFSGVDSFEVILCSGTMVRFGINRCDEKQIFIQTNKDYTHLPFDYEKYKNFIGLTGELTKNGWDVTAPIALKSYGKELVIKDFKFILSEYKKVETNKLSWAE